MSIKVSHVGLEALSITELMTMVSQGNPIKLGQDAISAVQKSRSFLEKRLANSGDSIYGINTGFGSLM